MKRKAFPTVDLEVAKVLLAAYIKQVGVQEAFNLHAYHGIESNHQVCCHSMVQFEKLVLCLLQINKQAEIKYI